MSDLTDVAACAVVLAAGINPRDLRRARQGMHRRMYVDADRLIALIDALDKHLPGAVAAARADDLAALDRPETADDATVRDATAPQDWTAEETL